MLVMKDGIISAAKISIGPTIRRGKSEQVVATPWKFVRAVEAKFGPITVDLAATVENAKAKTFITPQVDTFKQSWKAWIGNGIGWLNPEFDPMVKWVEYCAAQQQDEAVFVAIMPASVSTNWFWRYVQPYSTVYCLTPRIAFVGSHALNKQGQRKCGEDCEGCSPYPKDLMLAHYNQNPNHELQRWRWEK